MSTFLELTNICLTLLNEEPLDENTFNNPRGLHSAVKTTVRNVVAKINGYYTKWPFNAADHTMTLTVNESEYGWPINFRNVDWNSFYILKNEDLNIENIKLIKLSRDDWYNKTRMMDYDKSPDGRGRPRFVFEAHGRGFGISPSPNEPYDIRFRYFVVPPVLRDFNDYCTIPEEWEYVIINAVMYFMKMFKENTEISALFSREFKEDLKSMRSTLINDYDYMQDTRVHQRILGSNGR